MTNAFGVVLDSAGMRRAAAEAVPETVIAAIYLLHERSVADIVAKLRPGELEQVMRLVGRCPSCYPPGTLDALKGRSQAPAPEPVVSISTDRPPARIKPDPEDMRRPKEDRLARLRAHATRTSLAPERVVTPSKTGTHPGIRAETARRRMVVEDLRKAGLSVRMISSGTGIPVGSVHRAMRAIARAEAKKEVAVAEIAKELLGNKLRRGSRGRR
jgi:hypothetical protein